jgi:uncharacterized protein YigA (DUF484 family)
MSEEQQVGTTYEGLLQDQDVIDSMYYSLESLGEPVAYGDNKLILDTFLTKKRYFDTNLLSTIGVASDVEGMDDVDRQLLARSMNAVDQLPNFGEGSAPKGAAIADYFLAGVSDPTNLASAVAGAFTLGAGGAAGLAVKEAAKQGVRQALKAKIKNFASPAVLKSLAAEGTVAGVGGAYQGYEKQSVEKDIGLRKKIDPTTVALQGILEGTLSPVAGVAASMLGTVAAKPFKSGFEMARTVVPEVERATAWMERNLLPTAGLSEVERRLIERNAGQASSIKDRADKLTEQFNTVLSKSFTPEEVQGENSLINKALQGDVTSLEAVGAKDAEAGKIINDFFNLREEAFKYGKDAALNKKTRGYFTEGSEIYDANYVRNVLEAYAVNKRTQNFKEFLKENPDVLTELKVAMQENPTSSRWEKYTRKYMSEGRVVNPDMEDKLVREAAEELYAPSRSRRIETGAFKKRVRQDVEEEDILLEQLEIVKSSNKFKNKTEAQQQAAARKKTAEIMKKELPSVVRKILGYNNRPAIRIAETINGIVDTAARANTARDIGANLIENGFAVRAANPAEAIARLGTDDIIPLTQSVSKYKDKDADAVMSLPYERVDDDLKNIFVRRDEGLKLKELFDKNFFGHQAAEKDNLIGTAMRSFLGTQAFAKAGKTVYSPISIIRNALSAGGYVMASGNIKGLANGGRYIGNLLKKGGLDNPELRTAIREFQDLGLQGSNIDLNQTLRRFGDVTDRMDDGSIMEKFMVTGGLSTFGKPGKIAAKFAREIYGGVDDAAKFAVFMNERQQAKKVFDSFSPEIQQRKLAEFQQQYSVIKPTREDYINEQAAIKTGNVTPLYGRIPPLLEKMRAFPIIGSFTAYPAERLRNVYQILKTGTDEMVEGFETGNAALRNQGIKRLASLYAVQGAIYTGAYALNAAFGENETVDKMRASLPDWQKNSALIVTGRTKDGVPEYVDVSYLNPDQYVIAGIVPLMMKASRGEDVSKDLDESIVQAGKKLFEPYVSPSLALEAAMDLGNVITGKSTDVARDLASMGKALEPGYTKFVRDMAQDAEAFEKFGTPGSDVERFFYPQRFGTVDEPAEGFIDLLQKNGLFFPGLREEVFNPKRVMGYTLNTINSNAQQNFNSFASKLADMLSDPRSRYNYKDIMEDYDEVLQEQFTAQQAIRKLFQDMEGIIGRKELIKSLRSYDLRGVVPSKDAIRGILNGRSIPTTKADKRQFWLDINRNLYEKTGEYYTQEIADLRRNMAKLENFYRGADLRGDPPELQIGE